MADEGGEKTEMPTPKKLRDARRKGQVCNSKDCVSTAVLLVLMAVLGALGTALADDIAELLRFIGRSAGDGGTEALRESATMAVWVVLKHSFVFVLIAAAVAIAANAVQIGFVFSAEPLKPDLKKLNPAEGAKKIFCRRNFFEFAKNCVKVVFLGYLIYRIVVASIPALLPMCYGTLDDVLPCLKTILRTLAVYTAFGYIVVAVVDRIFQSKDFLKRMMMTKDEVKREYKEMEGSQEVKQAQRQFRDEILRGDPPAQAVKKADVVVTNPTRLAVGLRYRPEEAPLPKVVCTGAGIVARRIREAAEREGVPMVENVPLARALYAQTRDGDFVPAALVESVAEVLKWVKSLDEARREDAELDSVDLDARL